jgi:hypothetical protein
MMDLRGGVMSSLQVLWYCIYEVACLVFGEVALKGLGVGELELLRRGVVGR